MKNLYALMRNMRGEEDLLGVGERIMEGKGLVGGIKVTRKEARGMEYE